MKLSFTIVRIPWYNNWCYAQQICHGNGVMKCVQWQVMKFA